MTTIKVGLDKFLKWCPKNYMTGATYVVQENSVSYDKKTLFFNVLDHKLIDWFSRKSSPSSDSEDLIVIREIYDSENAQEIFEIELERAIQVSSY